jgi:hypothetical protein
MFTKMSSTKKFLKKKPEETNNSASNQASNARPNQTAASNTVVSNEENDVFRSDPDKKDSIPLLIIDVNIRPGVKKKIYVFDGDTAELLAEKFSIEHGIYKFNFIGLDFETRSKLQVLIQSHMSRLLMRIDEENQSVSEKSSTYNHS